MEWTKGKVLRSGTYVIEEVLGKGGFGISYKAFHTILKQHVVIKTPHEYLKNKPEYNESVAQLIREGEILAQLSKDPHPHIVGVRDSFEEGEIHCLVMDYIAGKNLFELVNRRGPLPEAEAVKYISQIAEALIVVHQKGLLHRDVKPRNIMLRDDRAEAVLIDFGIARDFTPDRTQSHTALYSDGYAPIEQYLKKKKRGAYTDIYGLAATLYFLLTKEVPLASLLRKFDPEAFKAPKQLNQCISNKVNKAIIKGMALEAKDRPQSMPDWLKLLEEPRFVWQNFVNSLFEKVSSFTKVCTKYLRKVNTSPPISIGFSWKIQAIRYSLYGAGGLTTLSVLIIGIEWLKVPVRPLPFNVRGSVLISANDGTLLNKPSTTAHRELQRLSEFSPYLPKAVIASQDSRYYWHLGVDPYGMVRALATNFRGGGIPQGASTLTQQMARSLFTDYIGRENSAWRKLRETLVALKLETFYSKDEILKLYLNRIYLGRNAFGFEDAAQFYFDKSATNLTLSEAATLVAILPNPERLNPIQNYSTALELRNRVITRMRSLGMISQQEADKASRSRIEVSPNAREFLTSTKAPYFYSYVFEELRQLLGEDLAQEGNFIVETALDLTTQAKAEASLRSFVNTEGSRLRFSQGALVTLNTSNGEIQAMVGGTDYQQSQFNRATQAKRPPGSTFKLFDYAAALVRGISPGKTYSCAPAYGLQGCERSQGAVDMYTGLARSENVIAVQVAMDAGLDNVVQIARRLGIRSQLEQVPRLAIGQSEVNVLEMTGSYAAIANRGVWNRPHAIKRILDRGQCQDKNDRNTCRVIYSFNQSSDKSLQAISPTVATTMTTMLQGVVQTGTGRAAAIAPDVAGKTGTSDDNKDLWFIGFMPSRQLATGIWLGNDQPSPTGGSSAQAAQLWAKYMRQVVNK